MKAISKLSLILAASSLISVTLCTKIFAFDWPFHKKMAEISYDMMSRHYPHMALEPLLIGCVQPDPEKKKGPLGAVGVIFENPDHKTNTKRINQDYHEAVKRFREDRTERGLYEGQRILAKSFHYVCDQTEPDTIRRFEYLFNGMSFRQVTQNILINGYQQYGDFRNYLNQITFDTEKFLAGRGFNPRDDLQVHRLIVSLRRNTEERINNVLSDSRFPYPQRAVENIIVSYYLPKLIALQNLMVVNFFWEINSAPPVNSYANVQPQLFNPRIRKPVIVPNENSFEWKDPGPVSIANPRPQY